MGIQILHPTLLENKNIDITSQLTLDVIAIHGLNGHPLRTWTSSSSQTLWFRDLLPHSLPRTRIMTFGYDATAAFSNSISGILEHARDLLRCVVEMRTRICERNRPVVFIAHSLGGLVLKQALLIASSSVGAGTEYGSIWSSTLGILFFGTPHRGSGLASLGATLARVPTALSMKPKPVLLHSLSTGSFILGELNEEFRRLMDGRGEGRGVVSFYETRSMRGVGMVVELTSATINSRGRMSAWEVPIPVVGNHRDMCQFGDSRDPTYVTAVHHIQRMRNRVLGAKTVKNEFFLVPRDLNPHFTGRNEMRTEIRDALLGERFLGEREQKTFVLFGLGGSGKTQIALKFAKEFRDNFWGVFFLDASSLSIVTENFDQIANRLKVPRSTTASSSIDTVKEYLAGKTNWLLIIDNADDPHLDISQFFPGGDRGSILMTTRNPDFAKFANAGSCCVEKMSEPDSITLLLKVSGMGEQSRAEQLQDEQRARRMKAANEVVRLLGCLALAIIQAGAIIRQRLVSLEGFPGLYLQRRRELLEIGRPNASIEYRRSVYTTWEISIQMIEDIKESHSILALELLRYFSFMHFDGIEESFFEAARRVMVVGVQGELESVLKDLMPDSWDAILMGKALHLLSSFSLVSIDQSRRITIHPLVHEWSRDRLSHKQRLEVWEKTVHLTAAAASNFLSSHPNTAMKPLVPHIDACLSQGNDQLLSSGPDLDIRVCAALVFSRVFRNNKRASSIKLSQGALECIKTKLPPGNLNYFKAIIEVGKDYQAIGRYKEVISLNLLAIKESKSFERSIAECQTVGNHLQAVSDTVKLVLGLARAYAFDDQEKKAIETCKKILEEYPPILGENNPLLFETFEVLATAYKSLSDLKSARKYLEKCIAAQHEFYGETYHSPTTGQLAKLYFQLKLYKKARALQSKVVDRARQMYEEGDIELIYEEGRLQEYQPTGRTVFSSQRRRFERIEGYKKNLEGILAGGGELTYETFICMEDLANDLFLGGFLEDGTELQEELVRLERLQWGDEHHATIRDVNILKWYKRLTVARRILCWWGPIKRYQGAGQ